jgi:curved DNA-binding protein CbpA
MPSEKNYYKILQVDPTADPEVIAAAYKRLSLKYHPDANPDPQSNWRMQEINEAYQVLKDPLKRRDYDQWRMHTGASGNSGSNGYPPPSYRPPRNESPSSPPRRMTPRETLADIIISITFPVTYILAIIVLSRVFRYPNFIAVVIMLILAGVIAYFITARVKRGLGR